MTLTTGDLKSISGLIGKAFDTKGVATKGDLDNFAKKSDLKDFATKVDLNDIKSDTNGIKTVIKTLATKKDIHKIDKKFDKLFDFLDKDFSKTKQEVKEIREYINFPPATL